jgi:hypothetical protein
MEQIPGEANTHSDSQEITSLFWNPKFQCRVHKGPPPVPVLSQMNSEQNFYLIFLTTILILSSQLRLRIPHCLFP